MNNQEIFDTVAKHLLTQNKRAAFTDSRGGETEGCMYRSADGCKCAVGVLIKDEFYDRSFEGFYISKSEVMAALSKSGVDTTQYGTLDLLGELQILHDQHGVEEWPAELNRVAEKFDLHFNPPSP